MRKYFTIIFALAFMLSGHNAAAQQRNLVSNAGFEEGQVPWQLDNWMKNEVAYDLDNKNPHSGRWCMKVAMTRVINDPTVSLAFQHLPLRAKAAVRVRF